ARLFSRFGSTVYVLQYRLPQQGWAAGPDAPLQDAQRAIRIIRARAADDGVDPARVMVMGFSAGGHVAGSLALRFDADVYDALDDADRLSARPDLAALIYPVATMREPFVHAGSRKNLIGATPEDTLVDKYSLEETTRADAPPTFLMHAADDESVPVENALHLFEALKRAGVPAAMHVFEKGGHGFGLRGIENTPLALWPSLLMSWAALHGFQKQETP
ncbi:MAG: alpha/beta hydrolase, partial [Oricola sp.]|nr:alpha/beta hydrolase [Oricola sp.]